MSAASAFQIQGEWTQRGCMGWYPGPGVECVTFPPATSLAPETLEAVMTSTGPLIPGGRHLRAVPER